MLDIRFGLATDLHIALPHTIPATTDRFHRTEISIATFEAALSTFDQLDLDFLLLAGDLTQDGEIDNHAWLAQRLGQLSYPVYVVPGNHDILSPQGSNTTIGVADFGRYYAKFGYANTDQLYYTQQIAPQVRLIGLNSIFFDGDKQTYRGRVDPEQMAWLGEVLAASNDELILVMVHHNVIEHLPGQADSRMGQRYMLQNAPELLELLARHGVQLVFTGHLHVQDVAQAPYSPPIYDIATGSTVSYPHPFRIMRYRETSPGVGHLQIESRHVQQIPGWEDLQTRSREYVGNRSSHFVKRMLTAEPLGLSEEAADQMLPELRYLWADIARGDAHFDFPQFEPAVRRYFEQFSCGAAIDNATILSVQRPVGATLGAPR
ncbi:MAG: metallophosphoesterase family protein [Elainellaceae cyanobacterium]